MFPFCHAGWSSGFLGGGAWGWGGMVLGMLLWFLLLAGLVLLIVWAIRRGTRATTTTSNSTALQVLQDRYARGEITREEYQQITKDLK